MIFKNEGKDNTIFSNTQDFAQKIENLTYVCPMFVLCLSYVCPMYVLCITYPTPTYNILCILSRDFRKLPISCLIFTI